VDGHVVEVPSIFHDWLRSMFKDRIRVERQKGALDLASSNGGVFGCAFDDVTGLQNRTGIGVDQIIFGIDYSQADSTYPASRQTAEKIIAEASHNDHATWRLVRGNAIQCFDLPRFGIVEYLKGTAL
jgi:hypothetical protein